MFHCTLPWTLRFVATLGLSVWFFGVPCSPVYSDVFVTGFFSGKVEKFNEQTKARSPFASLPTNAGLAGIAYSPSNGRFYVSALNLQRVYTLNQSGGIIGFQQLNYGPGGLAIADDGSVLVTDFTSNQVHRYNATMTSSMSSIMVPVQGVTSGIGYLNNGDLLIATAGTGLFHFDGGTVTTFTNSPMASISSAQVAADDLGNIFVGHGLGFSDLVVKYDSSGVVTGTIEITDAMVGGTGTGSSVGTSPAGVAMDASGNLFVAALGRSNPSDEGGERGGLFKFSPSGQLLDTFLTAGPAFSAVAIVNPPPNSDTEVVDAFVVHNAWSGQGSSEDSGKQLFRETSQVTPLSYSNMINTVQGINGVGFRIMNLANPSELTKNDFEYQMSPQGAFSDSTNPPAAWPPGPLPGGLAITEGSPDEIVMTWNDNMIRNRWLRITIKATPSTGLSVPEVYYVGHLKGEVTGVASNLYSVSFDDITQIRSEVGSTVTSENIRDINKDGSVNFSDISTVRTSVGTQLTNPTVP